MPPCPRCAEENPPHARFCLACGTRLDSSLPESRRLVTVLFCDVTGSTELGERQDPEQVRRVLSRYADEARAVLERHGGRVEKFIGDAVMAVFGIPVVHEDDALRAARAGLELREAIERLNGELEHEVGITIAARIGINSGEVVAGDPVRGEGFVTGDVVNVAKRLEENARGRGGILIGEETYRLARDAIQAEPVPALELKGKRDRVAAYRLLSVTPGALAHARRADAPIVGRERELDLLEGAFARAVRERSCHLFTLLGLAGVGKSRLLEEGLQRIGTSAQVLRGACLPYGEGITFWPVLELVKQATGVADEDPPREAMRKIASFAEEEDAQAVAERIAELVGLADDAGIAEEGAWAVRKLLESLARRQPLIVIFDDLNWAEQTLLDLIEHVADWCHDAPILLVCLSRPELLEIRPGWGGGKRNATSIFLEPLSDAESEQLIDNLVGGAVLDQDVRERIHASAAGNPLFVEEMVAMLVDEGFLRRERDTWVIGRSLAQVRVPPSIEVLLASRLDQLNATERRALERAAVEGNVFHRGTVLALSAGDERESVDRCLRDLVRKDLIRPHRASFSGEDGYGFRHPLIREATYRAVPKRVRGALHEAYAASLEARGGEHDEIKGYHLEQAFRYRGELGPLSDADRELAANASGLLASAGRRALSRGDVPAAADLLARAVALQPEGSSRRLELLPDLAAALRDHGELTRAEQCLEEALASARATGDRKAELVALIERAGLLSLSDPTASDRLLEEVEAAVPALEKLGDNHVLASAWALLGLRFGVWKGRFARGEERLEKALAHARLAGDRRQEAVILSHLCFAAAYGPTPVEDAIRRCRGILDEARGERMVQAGVLRYLALLEARRTRFDEARTLTGRSQAIYEELGIELIANAASTLAFGEIELLAGDWEAAERTLRRGAAALERIGERGYRSSVSAFLAVALHGLARLDEADEAARVSLEAASQDDIWSHVFARGIRARVLADRGMFGDARRCMDEAVQLVEGTDALDLRGTALLDLAYVLVRSGQAAEGAARAEEALRVFEQKGNQPSAERARRLGEEAGAAPEVMASEAPDDRAS